ncbi:MAG TPA: hypothetical protein VN714_21845, partial [Trebonia sp.]|nr:hypothetical protein [Trebonia sp.]
VEQDNPHIALVEGKVNLAVEVVARVYLITIDPHLGTAVREAVLDHVYNICHELLSESVAVDVIARPELALGAEAGAVANEHP